MMKYRVVDFRVSFEGKKELLQELYNLQMSTWGSAVAEKINFDSFKYLVKQIFPLCSLAEEEPNKPSCAIYFSVPISDIHSHKWVRVGFIGRPSLIKTVLSGVMKQCFSLVISYAQEENAFLWVAFAEGAEKMHKFITKRAGFKILLDPDEALAILNAIPSEINPMKEFNSGPPPSFKDKFTDFNNFIFTRPEWKKN